MFPMFVHEIRNVCLDKNKNKLLKEKEMLIRFFSALTHTGHHSLTLNEALSLPSTISAVFFLYLT